MSFWNKKIINFSPDAFGLDLSDLSIKVVQMDEDKDQIRVASFSSVVIPPEAIIDGEIIKKDLVVSKIKEVIQKAGPAKIKSRQAVCSIPETKAFLRLINIPKMDENEVAEAIKWEIEANIPLSLDDVYYDWKILKKNFSTKENQMTVLIIAVAKGVVDKFLETMEAAGVDVMGLEIESVAQIKSLIGPDDHNKTSLLIDFGGRRTTFLFAIGDVPCFTSSLSISSNSLTDSISKGLGISWEEAEKIKISQGVGSFLKQDPVFKSARPVLDNLILEIKKSTDFYLTGLRYSSSIDKIILCGGGSLTKGIIPYFSKEIEENIILGNPWVNIENSKDVPVIRKDASLQYSTAIGLALHGINIGKI